ncbi:MAG: (Fe-S)-binding protein [Chloroflexi bacterium]|nr:(Fe-S)-binding protein [Chloroflexota bacterium]
MTTTPTPITLTPDGMDRLRAQMTNMEACIRCGLCLAVCPTYQETLLEEESPRGRIALARAVAEGVLALTPDVVQHEENCLLCEACTAICPSGFRMEPLGLAIRESLLEVRPARRRLLLAAVAPFGHGRLLGALTLAVRATRRLGVLALLRFLKLGRVARLIPPIPDGAFVAKGQRWEAAEGTESMGEAVLFAGCVMRAAFPRVHQAEAEVLSARGFTVVAPPEQGCCGAVQAHAGLTEEAKRLARRNVGGLGGGEGAIVVDAAGCAAFMKTYGDLLRGDPAYAERAELFGGRVRESMELAALGSPPPMGLVDLDVTYQEPCHLVHMQGIRRQPRELLAQVPGLRLIEMAESDVCCGSAGIYNIVNPDMGGRLGQRKADRVRETGAGVVLTANPGCHLQLIAHLADGGVQVLHVLEVLAMSQRAAKGPGRSDSLEAASLAGIAEGR